MRNLKATQLKEYRYTTDRDEPCTAQISVRIPPSLKQKLKTTENWQELVRQTLVAAVEAEEAKTTN